MDKKTATLALIGLLYWIVLILCFWPPSPLHLDYVRIILVAAPVLIVPFCVRDVSLGVGQMMLLGGLFGLGMLLPNSLLATSMTIPWWMFSIYLSFIRLKKVKNWSLDQLLWVAQPLFLFTAACWALADRLQLHPLGFGGDIVLLTAVHFHYAGFALTFLASEVAKLPKWAKAGIVGGVGLVAVGITTSQLSLPAWMEVISVSLLALSAFRLALALFFQGSGWRRMIFSVAGLALASGMVLALAYGWRYYLPIPQLNIPVMYALHGSLNSLGFALPATWAALVR